MSSTPAPRIGVLALQGDVREHLSALRAVGAEAVPVRRAAELDTVAGMVIPGGESGVMDRLARTFGLVEPLRGRIRSGMPVYGTCAGLILLADRILDGAEGQSSIGGLDATVRRNVFGRQNDSFEIDLHVDGIEGGPVRAAFVRAPAVEEVGDGVRVTARLPDGRIVAVEQGNLIATAFHPELTGDSRFHARLLDLVRAASA